MSDLHRLPLRGHDLEPYYVNFPVPEKRWRVYSKRMISGHLYWYWRRELMSGFNVVGPFASAADAHKDIERSQGYAQAGPTG